MGKLRSAILAAAMLAFADAAGAQVYEPHMMSVDLPDGTTAQIRYYGEVAPQVIVAMAPPPEMPDFDYYECYDAIGYFGHYSPCFHHRMSHKRHGAKRTTEAAASDSAAPQGLAPQLVAADGTPGCNRHRHR